MVLCSFGTVALCFYVMMVLRHYGTLAMVPEQLDAKNNTLKCVYTYRMRIRSVVFCILPDAGMNTKITTSQL